MQKTILIIFVGFLISCKPEDSGLFEFKPSTLVLDEITLADIVDDVDYIPLDDKYPLGLIYDKILPVNNLIYLSVLRVGVLVFNMEGKLQRKIGSIGRGPGEYATCSSFAVDENNETVYILDIGNIVKVYSKTGRFLRSFQLNEYGDMIKRIEFFDARLFVSYGWESVDSKYEWIAVDTSGNIVKKKERTVPGFVTNHFVLGYSFKFDNTLSFYNDYTDTVFSILPDLTQVPSFIIAPGKHRLPKSTTSSLEEFSTYMQLQQIFETNHFIIIRYYYSFPVSKFAFVLTDKKSHKSFLTFLESDGDYIIEYSGGIKNDFDGGPAFLPRNYFMMNGREYMVGFINPYMIIGHVKSDKFKNSTARYPEKKIEIEKLANTLKETDNPILVLARLKK